MDGATNHNTTPQDSVRTDFLISDLHCPSCISNILNTLSELKPAPSSITSSLLSHTVSVVHSPDLSATTISIALNQAGYTVESAVQDGHAALEDLSATGASRVGGRLRALLGTGGGPFSGASTSSSRRKSRKRRQKVHVLNCEFCQHKLLSKDAATPTVVEDLKDVAVDDAPTGRFEATLAIEGMTCSSCVASISDALVERPWVVDVNVNLISNSATVVFEGRSHVDEIVLAIEDLGYEATIEDIKALDDATEQVWTATFSVEGMTCSSCVSSITSALDALPWVKKVDVGLIGANATVEFEGKTHVADIKTTIDDLGYEAMLVDLAEADAAAQELKARTMSIWVDGLYCEHCPESIFAAMGGLPEPVTVEKIPTLNDPILTITYTPNPPDFTIRHILDAIRTLHSEFEPHIHHPPTLEERAQAMRSRERRHILYRVILAVAAAIPSLVIGIVYMSLVSSSNRTRQQLMTPWANVSRAQWVLLIISTPVYFFAADIFHRRALREIYALWRPGSTVPLLRRLYRFGSMSLLVSLGVSIAYFSSIAELISISVQNKDMDMGDVNRSFYFDSVVFLTLFLLVGRLLEAWSKAKSGDAVAMLGKLRPTEATLNLQNHIKEVQEDKQDDGSSSPNDKARKVVPVDTLEVGDVVQVAHGTSPPCDGILLVGPAGGSHFDESSLTGESRPVSKNMGDKVYSGTINASNGPVVVRATQLAGTSMLDRIIAVVREGQARRAPIERIADRITGYFVPMVTLAAIVTWVVWLALGQSGTLPESWLDAPVGGWPYWSLQFAIAVFIIACPCGIGLAAPTALFVGGGIAAKHGILVKGGGEAFQESSALDLVVFDKTGTLTVGGQPEVTNHEYLSSAEGHVQKAILNGMVRAMEESSSHPLAKAVVAFLTDDDEKGMDVRATGMEELPGRGMKASFSTGDKSGTTYSVLVGNERLLTEHDVAIEATVARTLESWKEQGKSVVLVAVAPRQSPTSTPTRWTLSLIMAASDPLRPEAVHVVAALQQRGIAVWMISGDNPTTAYAVGNMVGIPRENIIAGVLPEQKAEKVQYLQRSQTKTTPKRWWSRRNSDAIPKRAIVAMVGDGVNDSPALSVSDVGIAIGSGSDVAISSAAFVLVTSDLTAISVLLDLSRTVFRRIKFNFGWALVYNLIALPVAAGVLYPVKSRGNHVRLDPVWASLAMALSSVSVVMSSLALRTRLPAVGFRATSTRKE